MPTSPLAKPKSKTLMIALLALVVGLCVAGLSVADRATAGSGGLGLQTKEEKKGGAAKGEQRYAKIFKRYPAKHKRWAKQTAQCESGKDPKAIGGGGKYRGAFQFRKDTWRNSPKSPGGDPIDYRFKTQAVVAVSLKKRDGAQHWPTCG